MKVRAGEIVVAHDLREQEAVESSTCSTAI
jgi:hypothetical protein